MFQVLQFKNDKRDDDTLLPSLRQNPNFPYYALIETYDASAALAWLEDHFGYDMTGRLVVNGKSCKCLSPNDLVMNIMRIDDVVIEWSQMTTKDFNHAFRNNLTGSHVITTVVIIKTPSPDDACAYATESVNQNIYSGLATHIVCEKLLQATRLPGGVTCSIHKDMNRKRAKKMGW